MRRESSPRKSSLILLTIVLLAATAAAQLTANPSSVNFGSVQVNNRATQSVVLTNSSGQTVTVSQVSVTGAGFTLIGISLPISLAPSQSMGVSVVFAPQNAGSANGSMGVMWNGLRGHKKVYTSTIAVPLSGTAVAPGYLSANPTNVDFGSIQVGSNQSLYETFTNTGGASVTITQVTVSGSGFSISGLNLPETLNSGESITFTATFAPTSAGIATGSISAVSNASDPNLIVSLSGSATSQGQLAASPATGDFGNVVVGTSQNKTGTLSASGASVTVSSAFSSSSEFTVSGITFPLTLAAGQNASFTLTFTPQSTGTASASVTFASNASNSPAVESLTGIGNPPPQHSASLSWGPSTSEVVGYNVYRSSQPGGPYTRINTALETATTYIDSTVQAGLTYFYVTTSVDSIGTESTYSNQAQAVIPTP